MITDETILETQEESIFTPIPTDEKSYPLEQISSMLSGTSGWLEFISIVSYIGLALALLGYIGMVFAMHSEWDILATLILSVVLCGILWYGFTITNLLSQAGKSIKAIQLDQSPSDVDDLLYCIRRYFKINGIGLIVYLGLLIVYILLAIFVPMAVN